MTNTFTYVFVDFTIKHDFLLFVIKDLEHPSFSIILKTFRVTSLKSLKTTGNIHTILQDTVKIIMVSL